jgi:hypothetical protein
MSAIEPFAYMLEPAERRANASLPGTSRGKQMMRNKVKWGIYLSAPG